jgi:phosphotransferase system enzyme I (PtsI)
MTSPRTHGPLSGVPVVPGVRYAPVIRPEAAPPPVPAASTPADPDAEATRFEAAVGVVAERLRGRAARATGPAAELLAVTAALATDKAWLAAARTRIAGGAPAERATAEAIAGFAEIFAGLGGLMAERVTDLNDIRDRVTAELVGWPEPGVTPPDSPSIRPYWIQRWWSVWPPHSAARPATRRSSPVSSVSPAWSPSPDSAGSPRAPWC